MEKPEVHCKRSILLVTNKPKLQKSFVQTFYPHCEVSVESVYKKALESCKNRKPHVVFIDQGLSDLQAVKLVTELHALYPEIVIVFLVDNITTELALQLWGKAHELLRKPVTQLQMQWMREKYCLEPNPPIAKWKLAERIIAQKFNDPNFSEQVLAAELGLCPAYFSRMFKTKNQKTFLYRLQNIRMNVARQLLQDTKLKVKEIARRVGYRRAATFIQVFRRDAGEPPSAYRNRIQYHSSNAAGFAK